MARLSMARSLTGVLLSFIAVWAGEARAASWDCPNPDEPCAPPYEQVVLEEGTEWQRMAIHGYAADDNGEEYKAHLYVVQNEKGLANVPLPSDIVEDLHAHLFPDRTTTFFVHQEIVDEIVLSQKYGELTPTLKAIAEPANTTKDFSTLGEACPNVPHVRGKTYNLNTTSSSTHNLGNGFSGTLSLYTGVQGSGTGEVHLQSERFYLFGACIPYGVLFDRVRTFGGVTVDSTASLSGTVNYTYAWESPELLKPDLFFIDFFIGPVPVHIGFNLPITVGLDLQASVTGNITFDGKQRAEGSFDYSCTVDGCGGSASYKLYSSQAPSELTGGVSGRFQPSVWAQAGLRGYLYHEAVAYAQVGVRPYLRGDLWGYAGNGCGDIDGNGTSESVNALTFDLDWQVALTAQASAFGLAPKKWNNLWSTKRYHLGFWNLGGEEALRPFLSGGSSAQVNVAQAYSAKLRPCWPYGDTVNYSFNWGDGLTSSASGAPQGAGTASHAWGSVGMKTLTLTASSDTHGRTFKVANTRNVSVADMPLPPGAHSFSYQATNTLSATQNTVDWNVTLAPGQTLAVGTCGLAGASATGDTYLRLVGPLGSVVISNDDACGGLASNFSYAVPLGAGGTYTLRAGCYSSNTCSGKVVWTVSGALYYSASNTSSATVNTANQSIALLQGETLSAGTCVVPGSSGSGDTFLRLFDGSSTQVAANDDYANDPNCGLLSYLQYTVPLGGTGTHQVRSGCFSSNTCSGTMSYVITGP